MECDSILPNNTSLLTNHINPHQSRVVNLVINSESGLSLASTSFWKYCCLEMFSFLHFKAEHGNYIERFYSNFQHYHFSCNHSVQIFLPTRLSTGTTVWAGSTLPMVTTTAPTATPSMTAGCSGTRTWGIWTPSLTRLAPAPAASEDEDWKSNYLYETKRLNIVG